MEYQRSDRVGDLLLEVVAELLRREIRDPRVQAVTFTGVKMSKDLRHARIYFNLFGGAQTRDDAVAGLKSASGFIRRWLGQHLRLRVIPSLLFCPDRSMARAAHIQGLLAALKAQQSSERLPSSDEEG